MVEDGEGGSADGGQSSTLLRPTRVFSFVHVPLPDPLSLITQIVTRATQITPASPLCPLLAPSSQLGPGNFAASESLL